MKRAQVFILKSSGCDVRFVPEADIDDVKKA